MPITITSNSATIGTTEYFLASNSTTATYQTTDCIVQVWLDLSNMTNAEEYLFKIYEKVNAGTARVVYQQTFIGTQATLAVSPSLLVGEGWEASVDKIAGTDRSIAWSIRTIT